MACPPSAGGRLVPDAIGQGLPSRCSSTRRSTSSPATSARPHTTGTFTPSWRRSSAPPSRSTPPAASIHPERAQGTRRFRRGLAAGRYEIHVTDVEPAILSRITPELHLDSVSNVTILAGELLEGGLEVAIQRIGLVGGRIVAVFRSDELEDGA